MESVRLEPRERITLARLDEIVQRGDISLFRALILDVLEDPNGYLACLAEDLHGKANWADPEMMAKEQLLALHHLISALRQYAPHYREARDGQRRRA